MNEDELNKLRVRKLKELVDQEETTVSFCAKWSKNPKEKPLNETYVSQLINGHRNFGEKSARRFERVMMLSYKYFDDDSADLYNQIGRTKETFTMGDADRVRLFLSFPVEMQSKILSLAKEEKTIGNESIGKGKESK